MHSAAPRKSKLTWSPCALSSVRFAKQCWCCHGKNMIGSKSSRLGRMVRVPHKTQEERKPRKENKPPRRRKCLQEPCLKQPHSPRNADSLNMPDPYTVS